jgi:sarcosine oxidase gamma subunit
VAEGAAGVDRLSGDGLVVEVENDMQVATLRYFSADGAFAQTLREALGAALPSVLQAVTLLPRPMVPGAAVEATAPVFPERRAAQLLLAWRSPTETLCLSASAATLAQLAALVAGRSDGCLVDLTSGLQVLRLNGERIAALLSRLGGYGSMPAPGEARRSRLADVPVLAFSVQPAETRLLVDRAYLPHLLDWIRETVRDLADL